MITLGRVEELKKVMESERMCRMAAIAEPPNYDLIKRRCVRYISMATGVNLATGKPVEVPVVTEDEVAELYDIFRQGASAKATDEQDLQVRLWRLDGMWPVMKRDMMKNRGFLEFVKDNGLDSDFMLQFYFDIPNRVKPGDVLPEGLESNSSHLMDTAYGMYICGNGTYREIPAADQASRQVLYEATWGGVRFRGANYCWEKMQLGSGATILTLGAGTIPEMRFFDWQNRGVKQRVIAYDDSTQLESALPVVFEKPLADYGIEYHFEEMKGAFKNPDLQKACDMVMIQGAMSYNCEDTEEILYGSKCVSRRGASICFERQLGEIGLANCSETLGWKENRRRMKPDPDVDTAVNEVSQHAKTVGLKLVDVLTDYDCGMNFVPTTVWFKLEA